MLIGTLLVIFVVFLALLGGGGRLSCSKSGIPYPHSGSFLTPSAQTSFAQAQSSSITEIASPSQIAPQSAKAQLLPGRTYYKKMTREQAMSRKSPKELLKGREGGRVRFSPVVKVQEIERVSV